MHPQERQNSFHLVMDIVWFGLAIPTTARFLSVYALRLGASPAEVNLLVSLPGLIVLFSAALSIWFQRIYPDVVRASSVSGLAFRFVFLLPAFTPLLPVSWQTGWLFIAISLPAMAQGIAIVTFVVMMRRAVHLDRFTPLLSQRAMAMNITVALSTIALGVWLVRLPFPFNYQSMFAAAFFVSIISWNHIRQVRLVGETLAPISGKMMQPWRDRAFRPLVWLTFVTHITFFAINPIISVYLVNDLGYDEQFIGFFMLAELLAAATAAPVLPWLTRRYGNRAMVTVWMLVLALSALLIVITEHPLLLILGGALNGAAWTALGVHLLGIFSRVAPDEQLVPYTISFHQVAFAATFIGPLLGTVILGAGASVLQVLLVGAILRIGAAFFAGIESIASATKRRTMKSRMALP